MTTQERDAQYAKLAEELAADASVPKALKELADDPRVAVRRGGAPIVPGAKGEAKCVVYWMQRAQRGRDNHALDKAVDIGNALGLPVVAFFAGINNFVHANARHYAFLNQGLPDVEDDCAERGVGFVMRRFPHHELTKFLDDVGSVMVIGDENPMRAPEAWRVKLAETIQMPYWTVDADVIVPSKLLLKAQFSAGVARPRLYRALPEFMVPYKNPKAKVPWKKQRGLQADDVRKDMTEGWPNFDRSVPPVAYWKGGHHAGMKRLKYFCEHLLEDYDTTRNHPHVDGTSRMSPYLHFGHVCNLTIALAVDAAAKKNPKLKGARDSFFNEVIAWRELSVNFVRYQPEYDSPGCADNWAKLTIAKHDRDEREHLYTRAQLEQGKTYDALWNAAQMQMVHFGWMHNYLRMYWAKKILEWTPNAAKAMEIAIWLNDRYEIDGRDPDGYSGIAWAMLGKFDRAWGERPVFGKRRFMSGASTGKKFDSKAYIEMVKGLES
jgi:deoxyribodipyrimidine photo-lyase